MFGKWFCFFAIAAFCIFFPVMVFVIVIVFGAIIMGGGAG